MTPRLELVPQHNIPEAALDAAAKAIAWLELTEKGRAECKWPEDFGAGEVAAYRAQAAVVIFASRAAIRSLIPNSAGDARTAHLQGEGEPVVKQVPSPAGTVSALNSQYAGLEALLAAIHADDPKRELLVRVGDLMRENRALLSQWRK